MVRAIFVALAVTLATGAAPAPYDVGVVYWSSHIPAQVAMRHGVEQAAAQLGARPGARPVRLRQAVGGEGDAGVQRQITEMGALVERHPDAVILQPIDSAALSPSVQQANAAGIPVVAYDQYVLKGKLACYLTSDNTLAGRLDGEYLAYRFRTRTANKPLRLVVVEYPYVSSTVERVEGLLDALEASRVPYRIVARYEAIETTGGRVVGRRIAQSHPPGSLDAVFCVNDGGGLAVKDELERAHRRDLVLATIDGDPRSVDDIRHGGLIAVDTAQFCGPLGAESMRWTYRLLEGERVPREVLLTVFPITRENAAAYPGWMGPIPARIRKPWPPFADVPPTRLVW